MTRSLRLAINRANIARAAGKGVPRTPPRRNRVSRPNKWVRMARVPRPGERLARIVILQELDIVV